MALAALAAAIWLQPLAQQHSVVFIDVAADYGITFEGIGAAMREASAVLKQGKSSTLFFGPGEHHVEMTGSLFNVTQLAAPEEGRLTLAGAGMLQTTLNLTTHGHDVITGTSGTKRLTVRDLTFARAPAQTTTQGSLMAVDDTGVTIKIQSGFPQIDELLVDRAPRIRAEQGLFLRRYHRTAGDGLHIVTNASCTKANGDTSACPWPETVNYQLHFACGGDGSICPKITSPSPGVWRLAVTNWDYATGEMQRYRNDMSNPAAVVGVKVKHGGQSFYLQRCQNITFESVRWLGHSRGILRQCDDVVLKHTRVERNPWIAAEEALSTPGGGPQVNTCNHLTVFNHTSVGTGDDSLGLFNIAAGSVKQCHIRDSFARGILLCNVSDEFAATAFDPASGNVLLRNPSYRPIADNVTCG